MRGKEALHEFDYGAVQLTGSGRMKEHYDRIHSHYLALDNDRVLKVFRQNAGLPAPGPDMGGWYDRDGFVAGLTMGQYISGLARLGAATNDKAAHEKVALRSEEHTSELQSLMRISYAVFCLKKKNNLNTNIAQTHTNK